MECVTSVATVENEQRVPSCIEAPEHTTTLEAGGTVASLVLDKGFYRVSSKSLSILECFNEDACVGGSVAGKYCAEGYTGPCKYRLFSSQSVSRSISIHIRPLNSQHLS